MALQILWTEAVEVGLDKIKTEKNALNQCKAKIDELMIMFSLICLDDSITTLKRVKIETLVTIHVHQRDVFVELLDKKNQLKELGKKDFDWEKQCRIYWELAINHCVVKVTDVDFV